MLKKMLVLLIGAYLSLFTLASAKAADGVIILNYHDIGNDKKNPYTITEPLLRSHFTYLKEHGYHPISLDQYMAACRGTATLPDKPVFITFDDGYATFYNIAYPMLKQFNYPAMLAIVTSWMENSTLGHSSQGYRPPGYSKMCTWDQIRELDASGLVSIASHSHASHRFTASNPQGDERPLLESRIYRDGKYESYEAYLNRVQSDLHQSQQILQQEIGHSAKSIVWPYGAYTTYAVDIARSEGFEASFGLEGGFNLPSEKSLFYARRGIIMDNPSVEIFAKFLKTGGDDFSPLRVSQLDIDEIYDEDNPRQTEANLKLALDRLYSAQVNTVFLQAFADTSGDGNIKSVYFHTDAAPVKADVFSHITNVLRNEGYAVYAWMPSLAGQWLTKDRPQDVVQAYDSKGKGWYTRATPFSANTTRQLQLLFSDLAAYAYVDGVLFQDDVYLNDYEDFSPSAKAAFRTAFGQELTPQNARLPAWTSLKTNTLTELTQKLYHEVWLYRPYAKSARNIYAEAILQPSSEEWLAQNYAQYLKTYDYTVIMAYPYLEKQADRAVPWLEGLTTTALQDKANASKTIFKLQTYDWSTKRWVPYKALKAQVSALKRSGAVNVGYYPENVFATTPENILLSPPDAFFDQ